MRLTVLMSTYNGETYLREQLNSILAQDIQEAPINADLKILIRDDGSTDSTLGILEEYKQKYKGIIDYYTGENLKTARSFWHLLRNAPESDYFAFSDQDDYWLPEKLSRAVKVLKNKGVPGKTVSNNAKSGDALSEKLPVKSVATDDIPLLYISDYTVTDDKLNKIEIKRDKINTFTDFPHSLLYSSGPGCTFVFNRSAREILKKYDMETHNVEIHDWLTHKIVAMTGKVFYDPESYIYYRQHGNNVIGMHSGGLKGFIRRVKMFSSKETDGVRRATAKSILQVYGCGENSETRIVNNSEKNIEKNIEKNNVTLQTSDTENKISGVNKEILQELAFYAENSEYKRKLLRDKRFYPGGINTLFLKFLILTERI